MQIKEFQSEENAGERIDKFLTEKVPELSRSYIQKLIKEKNVKVNSTVIKSNYKVAKGDQIQITIPDLTAPGSRSLYRNPGQCDHVSLQRPAFRNQRCNASGNRTPDRYGYYRFSSGM